MREEWRKAAIDGDIGAIGKWLDDSPTIDSRDRYGQTTLMMAATHGRTAAVDLLIAHGADLNVTAKYGLSALMLAIVNRHAGIATALLDAGTDTSLRGTGAPGFANKTAADLAREAGFNELSDAITLDQIARAFADRTPPTLLTDSKQLSDVEYDEVMSFESMRWQDVTFDQIERNSDAVFWFSPEAFCYFLPGLMLAGLKENRVDANCYDALIGMLDRSAEPDSWDDFFQPRWPLLTVAQVDAVTAWAKWLQSVQPDAFHSNTFERVGNTLALLAERRKGIG